MDLKIQDYFSLGYVYLLILGIFKDVIYYGFLGINILEYASVADVLLSPIMYLGKSPILFFSFCVAVAFLLVYPAVKKKEKAPSENTDDFYKNVKYKLVNGTHAGRSIVYGKLDLA